MKFILVVVVFNIFVNVHGSGIGSSNSGNGIHNTQLVVLYSGPDCTGFYLPIDPTNLNRPDLTPDSFRNLARSIRLPITTGVLLYDRALYGDNAEGDVEYVRDGTTNHVCKELRRLPGMVSSLRALGKYSASGVAVESLTFYAKSNMKGNEMTVTAQARSPNFPIVASLAIVGKSSWTLYNQQGLTGVAICIQGDPNGDITQPAIIPDLAQFDPMFTPNFIKSFDIAPCGPDVTPVIIPRYYS